MLFYNRLVNLQVMEKRLFIVSNRLPLTVDEEKGIQPSSGGLVSAMSGYVHRNSNQRFSKIFWAGVPGCSAGKWSEAIHNVETNEFDYVPVFANSESTMDTIVAIPILHYGPCFIISPLMRNTTSNGMSNIMK